MQGQVFGCANNHATCSLCCRVAIESSVVEDVDEEGMEVDNNDESAEENKQDDVVWP